MLVICPNCKHEFTPEDAFRHAIEEQVNKKNSQEQKIEIERVRKEATAEASKKAEIEASLSLKKAEDEAKEEKERNQTLQEQFLLQSKELREIKRSVVDEKIDMQKKMTEEMEKIRQEESKKAAEEHYLKDKEKDRKLQEVLELNDELKRKIQQGSQQTQGEVQEIDFEAMLKNTFPTDEIIPIEKGKNGADVKQIVKSSSGRSWGTILWESKRQKNWSDSWVDKLKEDLRKSQADIPALVSQVLPKEITNGMGPKDGIWVTNYALAIPLAHLLRKAILDAGYQKAVKEHSGRKADLIYDLVTGNEYIQNIQAVVDVYRENKELIDKERTAYAKMWKEREFRNERLISGIANIYGSIQGIAGSSAIPQIKGLDLPGLEDGE